MTPELIQRIEAHILQQWLETGNTPTILELIEEFDVTLAEVDEFIEYDEDEDNDQLINVDVTRDVEPLQPGDEGYELGFGG